MLIQVSCRYADTCGNEDVYLYKVVQADSLEAAEKVFPRGVFCSFVLEELKPEPLPKKVQKVPDERSFR